MATNLTLSTKRRKVRTWLVFITADSVVDNLIPVRSSIDNNFYVIKTSAISGSPSIPAVYQSVGEFKDFWKLHEKFTSFESAKSEVTRLAETVPLSSMHLVSDLSLVTDFLPRS